MFGGLKRLLFLMLLVLPLIISLSDTNGMKAYADEDDIDGEEDDILEEEEDEEEAVVDGEGGSDVEPTGDEEEEASGPKGSPDADTVILFTKPVGNGGELPAGKLVEFLVGFTNNGDKDFVLDTIDASFRYPMDFNFYIQNFTAIPYTRAVKPRQEATVMYSFYPAEAFAGRPLGLVVQLSYKDADGNPFTEAVFNQTVTITEVDEGIDTETFFLYCFLLALAVLALIAGHHFLSSFGRKKGGKKAVVEMGTSSKGDVDYDWIPKETLNELRKTPRTSPRQRKANRESDSK
ncbi:unnamed protein product [Meganyctiphanes norvegica]|uniref:Translocon-associated protein subunit alpha n=1 Tax=Meganyctiphanes norvegica TaxID=48144 RepID=A0AAV2Q806_MEGNR